MSIPKLPDSLARQLPRTVTGLLLTGILVACLVLGGLWLTLAMALVSALGLFEFFQICWPGRAKIPTKIFGLFAGLMLFCPIGWPGSLSVILTLVFAWAAVAFLVDYGRGNDNARLVSQAPLPLGILYLPVTLYLALYLSLPEQFFVVALAVVSDTAAYYVGCAVGRHKIWPRVSPGKTWEGSLAGFVAAIAAAVGIGCIAPAGHLPGSLICLAILGALLNIAAQTGDFFESALKRTYGVKDSGTILPGHGGILDRIDSILFALIAYTAIRLSLDHAAGLAKLFSAA